MKYTVLGSTGFVGSHVKQLATLQGHQVNCPGRDDDLSACDLGHVIYCIGLTSDFRQRPHETIAAHVTKLQQILTTTQFESLVYLSSTRVYARCQPPASQDPFAVSEDLPLPVVSSDFSDLYNISKLMGESIALTHGPRVKIARLSNVVGMDVQSDNFLISVLRDCVVDGRVELKSSLNSAKDYVSVNDVARVLLQLGTEGRHSIYNLASGENTTHRQIADQLVRLTNAKVSIAPNSPTITFPTIDISRLQTELNFVPQSLNSLMDSLVQGFRSHFSHPKDKYAA